jgi:hypothetical protein
MKESLTYILKARFGIIYTAVIGAVTMLLTVGIFAIPLMNMFRYVLGDPGRTKSEAAEILSVNFERSSTGKFEIVSLIAAAICAALLAKTASGFFKANGVSHKTSSRTLYTYVPITALILTAENLLMRLCLVRNTIYINSRSLKTMIFGSGTYDVFADRPSVISEFAGAAVYFAAALLLMYTAIIFVSRTRSDAN